MKAVRYHSVGGPEVLVYEEVNTPAPGKGEALVKVAACSVNRLDVWARSGRYKTVLPHVLGTDIAGEVVAVGPGTSGLEVGSEVVVFPVMSDGTCAYCSQGLPNLCVARGFVGVATDGGYADFVSVPSSNLVPTGGVRLKDAALMPVDFGTAWRGLAKAKVGHGDTVLVWGAAGGLGHAAVQVAKYLGAEVIAAVGDGRKSKFVESIGADSVVDYSTEDIVARVRSLTGGLGATVVFDHVGGDTWGKSIDSLARGGRMITLGLTSGPKSEVDVRRVYSDELSIVGAYGQSKADVERVLELVSEGKLRPRVHRELPLSSAREAHQILESRAVQGKLLLTP